MFMYLCKCGPAYAASTYRICAPYFLHLVIDYKSLNLILCTLHECLQLSAGLQLESFSVELVALAVWKEAVRICSDWLSSSSETAHHSSSTKGPESDVKDKSISLSRDVDFSRPETVYSWVEQGFLAAFDRAEMISNDLQDMDGNSEMPDAMEIIFQTALTAGKRGAVSNYFYSFFMLCFAVRLREKYVEVLFDKSGTKMAKLNCPGSMNLWGMGAMQWLHIQRQPLYFRLF
ncbi:hypothetical protein Taro_041130 [Colocasia esculenta]|uniref:ATG1a/b/c MIT domain-containing protein n=1 Tax=Colocasia esculenta TaxID=4460 RepID=A0A843WNX9_COLES|nr:hypothetical protein [Colocasia esculenta]